MIVVCVKKLQTEVGLTDSSYNETKEGSLFPDTEFDFR